MSLQYAKYPNLCCVILRHDSTYKVTGQLVSDLKCAMVNYKQSYSSSYESYWVIFSAFDHLVDNIKSKPIIPNQITEAQYNNLQKYTRDQINSSLRPSVMFLFLLYDDPDHNSLIEKHLLKRNRGMMMRTHHVDFNLYIRSFYGPEPLMAYSKNEVKAYLKRFINPTKISNLFRTESNYYSNVLEVPSQSYFSTCMKQAVPRLFKRSMRAIRVYNVIGAGIQHLMCIYMEGFIAHIFESAEVGLPIDHIRNLYHEEQAKKKKLEPFPTTMYGDSVLKTYMQTRYMNDQLKIEIGERIDMSDINLTPSPFLKNLMIQCVDHHYAYNAGFTLFINCGAQHLRYIPHGAYKKFPIHSLAYDLESTHPDVIIRKINYGNMKTFIPKWYKGDTRNVFIHDDIYDNEVDPGMHMRDKIESLNMSGFQGMISLKSSPHFNAHNYVFKGAQYRPVKYAKNEYRLLIRIPCEIVINEKVNHDLMTINGIFQRLSNRSQNRIMSMMCFLHPKEFTINDVIPNDEYVYDCIYSLNNMTIAERNKLAKKALPAKVLLTIPQLDEEDYGEWQVYEDQYDMLSLCAEPSHLDAVGPQVVVCLSDICDFTTFEINDSMTIQLYANFDITEYIEIFENDFMTLAKVPSNTLISNGTHVETHITRLELAKPLLHGKVDIVNGRYVVKEGKTLVLKIYGENMSETGTHIIESGTSFDISGHLWARFWFFTLGIDVGLRNFLRNNRKYGEMSKIHKSKQSLEMRILESAYGKSGPHHSDDDIYTTLYIAQRSIASGEYLFARRMHKVVGGTFVQR